MADHKPQPAYEQGGIIEPWQPMSVDMLKGLELAAYICRMYGDGERWAEVILSHGEQVRARYHQEVERRSCPSK